MPQQNHFSSCPTVKIKDEAAPGGHVIINESDFDSAKHKRFVEKAAPPLTPLPPPV